MADYIDREAFKKEYLCCGYLPEMSETEFDKFPSADVANERLADYLISHGVTVQGWISVKDRLPETDGIYIVCDRRLNGNPWIHTAGFRKASSSWCELHGVYFDDGYGRCSEQDKFTHWMPLPQPPKGETNNE